MKPSILQTGLDRYVIDQYLAEGGMGAIFLGKKVGMEGFEKLVVLKQLLPEFTSQREFIDLFLREARLSASLDHANIVHTYDLVAAGEDLFIVMEYVRGGDLRTILRRVKQRKRAMSPAAAIFIAREILNALAYAHGKRDSNGQPLGLIHRDISPSNIMVSAAGEVKLTDFGIAKAATHKSVFYRVKGKVGYMSPEQARADGPMDQRSDLYSLAVCLYEMLSNGRLFVADLLSTPQQIYSQPLKPLEGRPGMPPGIDAVLRRALAEDPQGRYATAVDFQDALVQVAFDSAMLFSGRELADHLRQVCGARPESWSDDEDVSGAGPQPGQGTAVLDQGPPHMTGVELTSVFAGTVDDGAPGPRRPQPRRAPADAPPTRALRAPKRTGSTRRLRAVADSSRPDEDEEWSDITDELEEWDELEDLLELSPADESEDPTVAVVHSAEQPAPAAVPPPKTPPPTDVVPANAPGPRPDKPGAVDPAGRSTTEVPVPRSSGRRSRLLAVALLVGLLAVCGVIIVVVGLSGPNLAEPDSPAPEAWPPVPTSSASPPDLGSPSPDLSPGPESVGLAPPPDLTPSRPPTPDAAPPAQASTGTLKVTSRPEGATVLVDGVRQCEATCTVEQLDPDRVYRLTLRLAGYRRWSTLVDLAVQRRTQISAYLSRPPSERQLGYLRVLSRPPAELYIDGKQAGWVSSEGPIALPPGEVEVTLHHPRRARRPRRLVTVRPRRTTTVKVKF